MNTVLSGKKEKYSSSISVPSSARTTLTGGSIWSFSQPSNVKNNNYQTTTNKQNNKNKIIDSF